MINAYNLLTAYLPCAVNLKIKVVDGSLSSVVGKMNVQISDSIILKYVLHVPNLSCNLISISQQSSYFSAKFLPSNCLFQNLSSGKMIDSVKKCERLYYFH